MALRKRLFAISSAISLAIWLGPVQAVSQPSLSDLKFSAAEIELLKRINQIETGAGIASTMLKAAPFITLFSSPNPMDVAITIGTNDWDKIYGSLTALQKISACKIVEAIDLWHDADGNDYSSNETELFFSTVKQKADRGC